MVAARAPRTLQQAIVYFSDPDVCLREAIAFRWPDGVVRCPTCGETKVAFIKSRRTWQCSQKHSRAQFSVKIGTIMEDSPLGLDKWLVAIWLLSNAKNGISSYELARAIGITQKSAWFMLHRVRLAMQDEDGGKLGGDVEVDETFIGAKARNMHADKKRRIQLTPSNSMVGKTAVMGLLARHSERGHSTVRLLTLDGRGKKHLQTRVREHVEPGASVNTDALLSYNGLDHDYVHNVIDHAEKYVEGTVHTNGLENFWSLLKRTLGGTYVSVQPFHMFRYLDEQAFRFNSRKMTDAERAAMTARAMVGKRVTFKGLTGKDLPQTC